MITVIYGYGPLSAGEKLEQDTSEAITALLKKEGLGRTLAKEHYGPGGADFTFEPESFTPTTYTKLYEILMNLAGANGRVEGAIIEEEAGN